MGLGWVFYFDLPWVDKVLDVVKYHRKGRRQGKKNPQLHNLTIPQFNNFTI